MYACVHGGILLPQTLFADGRGGLASTWIYLSVYVLVQSCTISIAHTPKLGQHYMGELSDAQCACMYVRTNRATSSDRQYSIETSTNQIGHHKSRNGFLCEVGASADLRDFDAQYQKLAPDAAAPHRTPQMRGIHVTGLVSWRRIFKISSVVEAPGGEILKPMKVNT